MAPKPKPQSQSLVEQIRSLHVGEGHMAIWALGQSGFLLKGGPHVVIIDPYLSDYVEEIAPDPPGAFARMVPIAVRPEELGMVTVILSTHHHADHCDPHTLVPLLNAAPHARLLASHTARDVLLKAGVDPFRPEVPPVGEAIEFGGGLTITAIPSAHYGFDTDASGNPA